MLTIILTLIFVIGYAAVITEYRIRINKAAVMLMAGALSWILFFLFSSDKGRVTEMIGSHMAGISGILFFLLGAMTIVELIDSHDGFDIIVQVIRTRNKRTVIWILSLLTFFLSAVLDNLTTAIVMMSLARKMIPGEKDRWLTAGLIIIAANSGGAWSPMGDVTTTMLWIGGQITPVNIISKLIIPSLVCLLVPLAAATFMIAPGSLGSLKADPSKTQRISRFEKNLIFFSGIFVLVSVPVVKTVTHAPPYVAMLLALGFMWALTEIIHRGKDEEKKSVFTVVRALKQIDTATILFFLGILLCISALESSGILHDWAAFLMRKIPGQSLLVIIIGFLSAVIDNVPLVAAVQGMYPLSVYPPDHFFWEFLALATGTGGSILIIGSAAGVAVMGMEKITFTWYLKRIALLATLGYLAGALTYILLF